MRRAEYQKNITSSYADDGLIENNNPVALQADLDIFIKLFEKMGLKTNETKTKFMIIRGTRAPTALSSMVYNRVRSDNKVGYKE